MARRLMFETESCGCVVSLTPSVVNMTPADFVRKIRGGDGVDHMIIKEVIATATRALLAADEADYMRGWSAAGRC